MDARGQKGALAALVGLATAAFTGCGGGGTDNGLGLVSSQYVALLPQSATATTMTSALFQDSFSAGYLDGGMTKAQLVAALSQAADAAKADASATGFPVGTLSDVSVSGCDSSNVCTLSATLTNSDGDAVSVPFTTKVVLEGSSFRLYGDQQSS